MCKINILSDFSDYYDDLADSSAFIKYDRFTFVNKPRGKALSYLKQLGIKTVEFGQVSNMSDKQLLVVYKDVRGHHCTGKEIMSFNDAKLAYGNFLASEYIKTVNYMKYIQVGNKSIHILYEKDNDIQLGGGKVKDIKISNTDYPIRIGLPIFSIDYVPHNDVMVATDFNEVQNLSELNIQDYISKEEVIEQIYNSLIKYNKA